MQQSIKVGEAVIPPSERAFGSLLIGQLAARTEVRIPFQVLNGTSPGPRLCLEATLHGWEPMGAEIIRRAMLRVDPKRLKGAVFCLPLANPLSVEFGGTIESSGMRVNPSDTLDLNRVWPGKKINGWLTEQIADALWTNVISQCEYLIDLHDGTGACDELPVAFPHGFATGSVVHEAEGAIDGIGADRAISASRLSEEAKIDMNEKIRGLAIAFGSPVIWWREGSINPSMLSGQCALHGIVPLVAEAGGGCAIDHTIDAGAECLLNVLKHLGMIEGDPVLPPRQIMVDHYLVYRSLTGGFYLADPEIQLGATVEKGQELGKVVDPLTSEVLETCTSSINGIIISRRIRMPINPGGYIAHIANTDAIVWERSNG